MSQPSIDSPCIKVCRTEYMADRIMRCVGCYRTLFEISDWTSLPQSRKDVIMSSLQFRKLALEAIDTNYR